MSKYLEFHKSGWTGKTDIYEILSKKSGDILGRMNLPAASYGVSKKKTNYG